MQKKIMKKQVVVHLGNVGEFKTGEKTAEQTIRFGQRRPLMTFFGIDLRPTPPADKKKFPKNIKQRVADFIMGLNRFKDNSVYAIRSELSVGHFDQKGEDLKGYHAGGLFGETILTETPEQLTTYTSKIINIAYRKLEPGGKLKLVVGENVLKFVKKAIENSPFIQQNIKIAKLTPSRKRGAYWQKKYQASGVQLYRIIAAKQSLQEKYS